MAAGPHVHPTSREPDGPSRRPDGIAILLALFDCPLLILGFRTAIEAEPDMDVVADLDPRADFANRLREVQADVVVTECGSLEGGSPLAMDAVEAVRAELPAARILAVEGNGGMDQYARALRAGATGYISRDAATTDLVAAIRCVHGGDAYVSPALVTRLVQTYVLRSGGRGTVEDAYEGLTEREREVLLLAATGHTNREIGGILHLSEQTIHNYRATVMEKLGFHDRVDLIKYAIRRGVISVDDL
jgi:two-component system, NarL family, response regulator NreC